MVINTEWGALGNTGSLDFVRTRWDHAVDAGSKNFGKQVRDAVCEYEHIFHEGHLVKNLFLLLSRIA